MDQDLRDYLIVLTTSFHSAITEVHSNRSRILELDVKFRFFMKSYGKGVVSLLQEISYRLVWAYIT